MQISKLAHKVFTETLLRTESYALATAAENAFRKTARDKQQGNTRDKKRIPGQRT